MSRRELLHHSLAAAGVCTAFTPLVSGFGGNSVPRRRGVKIKLGVNAYSFNRPLVAGKMTMEDVIDFCARHNVDGLDATGYYFPGYPKVPSDEYIYRIKRTAYIQGVTISGTGVRNDFALTDKEARRQQIQLVKDWIQVAQKLGAGFVRVFSGREVPAGHTFDEVLDWMIPALKECAEYGGRHGVIVGLQHHDDFLKTAAETIRVVDAVGSPWLSVILDVGSLRQNDPYEEIERLLPYACTWQIKENVWYGAKSTPIDLPRIKAIIDKVGFRGFLPIEALGEGDAEKVVATFLAKVRKVMEG
jgi:sugar phosphate isomerase/epimerase